MVVSELANIVTVETSLAFLTRHQLRHLTISADICAFLRSRQRNIEQALFCSHGFLFADGIRVIDGGGKRDNPLVGSNNEDILEFKTFNAMHRSNTDSVQSPIISFAPFNLIATQPICRELSDIVVQKFVSSCHHTNISCRYIILHKMFDLSNDSIELFICIAAAEYLRSRPMSKGLALITHVKTIIQIIKGDPVQKRKSNSPDLFSGPVIDTQNAAPPTHIDTAFGQNCFILINALMSVADNTTRSFNAFQRLSLICRIELFWSYHQIQVL